MRFLSRGPWIRCLNSGIVRSSSQRLVDSSCTVCTAESILQGASGDVANRSRTEVHSVIIQQEYHRHRPGCASRFVHPKRTIASRDITHDQFPPTRRCSLSARVR
ncbi:hypothetical protein LIA77_06650 [Sarocladium implicatum]|nr:hypothetical protein LIA77_06650 [Sarocladium implicatum]